MWADFMDELRHIHLGAPAPEKSVLAELQDAYLRVVAGQADAGTT